MIAAEVSHVVFVLLVPYIGTYAASVERQTTLGAVSGRQLNLLNTIVEEYVGIPYAKPPLGDLRSMAPLPMEPWQGTLNATQGRTGCLAGAGAGTYTEDCLLLNVWTSHLQSTAQQGNGELSPVLVWIPGGGFSYGSAAYDNYTGSILAAKTGFVVFSMNYRVGEVGFLGAISPGAPGNLGLLDQNLALRWIKDNARNFGGDPSKVTLFGENFGELSIHGHVLSPLSRGLFSSAVILSGSTYSIDLYDTPEESFEKANRLAEQVGCSKIEEDLTTHPDNVLGCLISAVRSLRTTKSGMRTVL